VFKEGAHENRAIICPTDIIRRIRSTFYMHVEWFSSKVAVIFSGPGESGERERRDQIKERRWE